MIQIKKYKDVKNLLSKGGNAKINKNSNNLQLIFAPHTRHKGVNLCPKASKGALACLFSTGRGRFKKVEARIIKPIIIYLTNKSF